jgi:hypothetical protein
MDGALQGEAGSRCSEPGFVFCDDFEDGADGWKWTGASWTVKEGGRSEGESTVFGPTAAAAGRAIYTGARWQDVTVEVRVRVVSFGQATSTNRAEVLARHQSGDLFYAASLRGDGKLGLRKNAIGLGTAVSVSVSEGQWHTLGLRVSGSAGEVAVEALLDGRMVATAIDADASQGGPSSTVGSVGLGVYGETLAVFDDLKVSSP